MTAPTFGQDTLCHSCGGTGDRQRGDRGRLCFTCSGTGVIRNEQAVARRDDPDTSHAAAATVNTTRGRAHVLSALKVHGPMTDQAIYGWVRSLMSESGARTRRSELVGLGLVYDTGRREKTAANRDSIVWAAR